MFNCLKNIMDSWQLDWKRVSSFSADNANFNFGANHSLYTNICSLNDCIIKVNCGARILHNTCTVKFALGNLNLYIENIFLEIYGPFSTSAKTRETLKEFHIFAEIEFVEILRHAPTIWLSSQPCIERLLLS